MFHPAERATGFDARTRDSKAQAEGLASRLRETGVEVRVVAAEGKTHATINRELGDPDDAPTGAVFEFLRGRSLGFIPVMGSRRVRTNLFSSASQNSDRSFMVSW